MDKDKLELIVKQFMSKLIEHDVVVQVMISFEDKGESIIYFNGHGNWFARQGMAHEFINKDSSETLANTLRGKI